MKKTKTKCPFCSKEYINVAVHLRFCPSKKKVEAVPDITVDPIQDIPEESKVEISDEQLQLVKEIFNKDLSNVKGDQEIIDNKSEMLKTKEGIYIKNFNETKDKWIGVLEHLIGQAGIGDEVVIELQAGISHEFTDKAGNYSYPDDVFINILRHHCDKWVDEVNGRGKQVFKFIKQK